MRMTQNFNTILNVDGVTFQINGTGALANGDSFQIIDADQIVGTPTITSVVEGQNWVFDATSGLVCLGSCAGGVAGDFNGNGMRDAEEIDLLSVAINNNDTDAKFDLNGDGSVLWWRMPRWRTCGWTSDRSIAEFSVGTRDGCRLAARSVPKKSLISRLKRRN